MANEACGDWSGKWRPKIEEAQLQLLNPKPTNARSTPLVAHCSWPMYQVNRLGNVPVVRELLCLPRRSQ